jgi:hypothetical protein
MEQNPTKKWGKNPEVKKKGTEIQNQVAQSENMVSNRRR